MEKDKWKRLSIAALIAAVVHLIAGLCMALVLRQGLDTTELSSRLHFLVEQRWLWIIGWASWNCAAFAILAFYFCFVDAHKQETGRSWILHLALLVAVAGVAIDFCAEAIEIGVLPELAQMCLVHTDGVAASSTELFLTMHRTAVMLTGCMSNELYTLAAALLILFTYKQYKLFVNIFGLLLIIGGIWLSVACLFNSINGMFLSNLLLLPSLILWLVSIAYTARQKRSL